MTDASLSLQQTVAMDTRDRCPPHVQDEIGRWMSLSRMLSIIAALIQAHGFISNYSIIIGVTAVRVGRITGSVRPSHTGS